MTPELQAALSIKYSARPLVIIPSEDLFFVFDNTLDGRKLLSTFSPAELTDWLRKDFARQRSQMAERKAAERKPILLDLPDDFDFNL